MKKLTKLNVLYHGEIVGALQETKDGLAAFQYDPTWLAHGFSISPRSLPLHEGVFVPKHEPFTGLFGVFADSLPDGWGRLLVDRMLLKQKLNPHTINNLTRLAIVGASGMGALTYEPDYKLQESTAFTDLDQIALECKNVLTTDYSDNLDELFALGGSSGGARPKILTKIDSEDWIVKFPSSSDSDDIGLQEYEYALCAHACGIEMAEAKLLPSQKCAGYFATRRFDRVNGKCIHMLSASGILETSHRIPNLDYDILMRLTAWLTNDMQDLEKLYKLMCFNVFAHNRDDHSKNFSYIYDDEAKTWHLSPAYDLTYSYSLGGEHATTVHGNGANPGLDDLLTVAKGIGLNTKYARTQAFLIKDCVQTYLGKYLG